MALVYIQSIFDITLGDTVTYESLVPTANPNPVTTTPVGSGNYSVPTHKIIARYDDPSQGVSANSVIVEWNNTDVSQFAPAVGAGFVNPAVSVVVDARGAATIDFQADSAAAYAAYYLPFNQLLPLGDFHARYFGVTLQATNPDAILAGLFYAGDFNTGTLINHLTGMSGGNPATIISVQTPVSYDILHTSNTIPQVAAYHDFHVRGVKINGQKPWVSAQFKVMHFDGGNANGIYVSDYPPIVWQNNWNNAACNRIGITFQSLAGAANPVQIQIRDIQFYNT